MNNTFFALLIQDESQLLEPLKLTLKEMSVLSYSVQTCEEARRLLDQVEPLLVFTATTLSDGSWPEVINLVEKAGVLSDVIVVAPTTDMKLYMSALERGAFDFVAPPFEHDTLSNIVKSARLDVTRRKAHLLRVAVA